MRLSRARWWMVALMAVLTAWSASALAAAPRIEARGLMRDMAVLNIDGRQRVLKVGETSPEGVVLVSADTRSAEVLVGGRSLVLTLSDAVGGRFAEREVSSVQVHRDTSGRYRTAGAINGRPVSFLVDTGANIIAMSSGRAASLGIDFRSGQQGTVATASGVANSWFVQLDAVTVGTITVTNVNAAVIEGGFPQEILLGHSFLQHVSLEESQGVMTLRQRF